MAFQEVVSLDCDNAIQLGGKDRKSGKSHPTRVEGFYIGSKEIASPKSKTGFSKLHVFQTEKGNTGVWGKTDLDRKLASTTIGAMTRVTYTGMKETKNNPMYVYKVEVDLENVIEVGPANESGDEELGNNGEPAADYDDANDDVDPGEDAPLPDELPPARAAAPRQAAQPPSAAAQKKVQDLLAGRRKQA